VCHAFPKVEMIIKIDIAAYRAAIQIFNHLLICGLRKTERKIIKIENLESLDCIHYGCVLFFSFVQFHDF
jgi:hypothetical protein